MKLIVSEYNRGVVCYGLTTTMAVMNVPGVSTYLGNESEGNVNLFIQVMDEAELAGRSWS